MTGNDGETATMDKHGWTRILGKKPQVFRRERTQGSQRFCTKCDKDKAQRLRSFALLNFLSCPEHSEICRCG